MTTRSRLSAALVLALIGAAIAAGPAAAAAPADVRVTTENGGVQVSVARNGQGTAGASSDDDGFCASVTTAPVLCLPAR